MLQRPRKMLMEMDGVCVSHTATGLFHPRAVQCSRRC